LPFAALKRGQNIKYRPHAFTEPGALMAANRSDTAPCPNPRLSALGHKFGDVF